MSHFDIFWNCGLSATVLLFVFVLLDIAYDKITGTKDQGFLRFPGVLCLLVTVIFWPCFAVLKIWGF